MTKVLPGWLLAPWQPITVLCTTMFCFAFLTQLAFAMDEAQLSQEASGIREISHG